MSLRLLMNNFHLKQEEAGDGQGGGGSLLTNNTGGSGSSAAQGGAGGQSGANSQNAASATGDKGGGAQGGQASDWRSTLPAELREDPALKTIHDVQGLAKSYLHAQRMVGADKISVPGKHATEDDWKQAFTKLGLPADLKDYALDMKESPSLDKKFIEDFKKSAHEAGVLPKQAQKLASWFEKTNGEAEAAVKAQIAQKAAADLKGLENEWGAAYKQNLAKAGQVLREVNDPELNKYLDDTGLGNDPRLIKMFHKISDKFMKEDAVVEGAMSDGRAFTPAGAQKEISRIMADTAGPYYNAQHPGHKAAVAEMNELFAQANGKK